MNSFGSIHRIVNPNELFSIQRDLLLHSRDALLKWYQMKIHEK